MMAMSPALPGPGPSPAALEQRRTRLDPVQHPRNMSRTPSTPQNPQKRGVSPPPVPYTLATSLTMLSTPTDIPRSPSMAPVPLVHPRSPQTPPKRAVSPPLARFDWADDAASLPTAPTQPRDFSDLRTGRSQPFGMLRRRTRRRRRIPPQVFLSRNSFHSPLPSSQLLTTRRYPLGSGPGRPVITIPVRTLPTPVPHVPKLNWDCDPRLADLSRALQALGWTPPC
jgi:hypothetical protein